MEIQYIFLRLPESWCRKVEQCTVPVLFLTINLWGYECQVAVTVKMWLNVFSPSFFFTVLVQCLCRGHPTVFVGSVGLSFY